MHAVNRDECQYSPLPRGGVACDGMALQPTEIVHNSHVLSSGSERHLHRLCNLETVRQLVNLMQPNSSSILLQLLNSLRCVRLPTSASAYGGSAETEGVLHLRTSPSRMAWKLTQQLPCYFNAAYRTVGRLNFSVFAPYWSMLAVGFATTTTRTARRF